MNLDRLDIERVLMRLGIEAKRKGREWFALCPNPEHADHSPSWHIRDDPGSSRHGFHKCWPCGFGGTVVDLVQKLRGISDYRDARAWLLEGTEGVEQKAVSGVEVKVSPPALRFRLPPEVTVAPIEKWPEPARDYFVRVRGLEPWQAERWGVGYASAGRLRGRVVFVLRDRRGRPLSYSARTFTGEGKRFLEPEEHERASPTALFGEQHWPEDRTARSAVFVFEGAIKALAAEAALPGVYVAASRGSEPRPLTSTKLATFERVCLVGDDDAAGDKVSSELHAQLVRHADPERLVLPRGLDADRLPREELREILLGWLHKG